MERFWHAGAEQLVFWLALLAVLVAVAFYVLGKIRPKPLQKEPMDHEWLTKCREMHSQGGLSDEEFRTIKTVLAPRVEEELNNSDDEG